MKLSIAAGSLLLAAALLPPPVHAQSDNDLAGWFGMMQTPIGAFVPTMISPAMKGAIRARSLSFQGSGWSFEGDDTNHSLGITLGMPVGLKSTASGTIGFFKPGCSGCDGTLMLSGDIQTPMWERASLQTGAKDVTSISFKGSVGYGHYMGDGGGTAVSLLAAIPIALRHELVSKASFSGFISPGIGYGHLSGGGAPSEGGMRPVIGGGVAWTATNGIGVHVGFQKILISSPSGSPGFPTTVGIALSLVP